MLLEIQDGTISRGGEDILLHFDFYIKGAEHMALVGANGAGKTTLLEVLAGISPLDRDDKRQGVGRKVSRDVTMEYLKQDLSEYDHSCVKDFPPQDREKRFYEILGQLGAGDLPKDKTLRECSGGEKKKVLLAHVLTKEPELLLLDEPTNHLDIDATLFLERFLREYKKAVVLVSHDRFFMDRTVDTIYEVSDQKCIRYVGNYTAYRKEKQEVLLRQQKAYIRQQEEIKREKELIERFRHKPKKASFARSRQKMLDRMELVEKPKLQEAVIHTSTIEPKHLGPKNVYEAEKLVIGYEKEHPVKKMSLRIRRGQKIGIIGANGTGKTTFLRTVIGQLMPLGGKGQLGNGISMAYFDQKTAEITSELSIFDYVRDLFPSYREKEVRELLARFLFFRDDLGKKVSSLSGGEKSRLVLMTILEEKPNFLVLDEPTNHMDIPAKETLESIFKMYQGTMLVISHDRYFLSQVTEQLLIFDAEEENPLDVYFYPFNYAHYMERLELGNLGTEYRLLRSAEEQRMIEGLRAVPKGERHRLKEYSTAELNRDWRYEQNRDRREESEEKVRSVLDSGDDYISLEDYMSGAYDERLEEQKAAAEEATDEWTEDLLDWYDIYLETHPNEEDL